MARYVAIGFASIYLWRNVKNNLSEDYVNSPRKIFDDIVERVASFDLEEKQFYLFLTGNAGTGKTFLLKQIIEAVKVIKIKAGDQLNKPPAIVMAPTANAAFLIQGKTIDSVLGFLPTDTNNYVKSSAARITTMKHNFEDICLIVCDEVSMVGSSKLLKINYRLQDIADGKKWAVGTSSIEQIYRIHLRRVTFYVNKFYI